MATPSNVTAAVLPGNLEFSDGGMAVDWLTGAFVKSVTDTGLVTLQAADGSEMDDSVADGQRHRSGVGAAGQHSASARRDDIRRHAGAKRCPGLPERCARMGGPGRELDRRTRLVAG